MTGKIHSPLFYACHDRGAGWYCVVIHDSYNVLTWGFFSMINVWLTHTRLLFCFDYFNCPLEGTCKRRMEIKMGRRALQFKAES